MGRTRQSWSIAEVKRYWSKRPLSLVLNNPYKDQHLSERAFRLFKRAEHRRQRFRIFVLFHCGGRIRDEQLPHWSSQISDDLEHWCTYNAWSFCSKCHTLLARKLTPSFRNRRLDINDRTCTCQTDGYVRPRPRDIPRPLRNLSWRDVCCLRPLDLHQGDYTVLPHGYRQKTTLSRCSWSRLSVRQKIRQLPDAADRQRCRQAYDHLMACTESSYCAFVQLRASSMGEHERFNMYDFRLNQGIECALWPHLYPYTAWCESVLSGDGTRSSTTRSFLFKVKSQILDYSLTFDLLQFQYDSWLFRTVSGAITTGILNHCSPARSLDGKVFSPQFWKWHHLQLLDSVRQFGYPQLFLTISPYEWTYPYPTFLRRAMVFEGRGPTQMATLESLHIAHTLEQLVRGYMTGANNKRWRCHLLCHHSQPAIPVVKNYFYRLEFQGRGTCHVHVLVWLDLSQTDVRFLRADIPWDNTLHAFLVHDLQPSHSNALPVSDAHTTVTTRAPHHEPLLKICHPYDAFLLNLRGYVSTLLPALRCRMDVQATDHRAMILRYVTSYVAKIHDAQLCDEMFSTEVTPYMAAYRHLSTLAPCEPEMLLHMSTIKLAWTSMPTKRLVLPKFHAMDNDPILRRYIERDASLDDWSLLQWARWYSFPPARSQKQKQPSLVGVRFNSIYHEQFFLQDVMVHYPFRDLQRLLHTRDGRVPLEVRFFAAAIEKLPARWTSPDVVAQRLQQEGHNDLYIANVLAFIKSKWEIVRAWENGFLISTNTLPSTTSRGVQWILSGQQVAALELCKQLVHRRQQFYDSLQCFHQDHVDQQPDNVRSFPARWNHILVIEGGPGTGKTHFLNALVHWAVSERLRVAICTPTGIMVSRFLSTFPKDVRVETVHSMFRVPVQVHEPLLVNDELASFDVLLVDELSMVPLRIFWHILDTLSHLHVRPFVVMVGDPYQQQPIDSIHGSTTEVPNAFTWPRMRELSHRLRFTHQYRSTDQQLLRLLGHLRFFPPTCSLLTKLCGERVLCPSGQVNANSLWSFFQEDSKVSFLTVTRSASRYVNHCILEHLFSQQQPLCTVFLDYDPPAVGSLYVGMRVMVTRNVNKQHHVVNGQRGTITHLRGATVQLKTDDRRVFFVYPLTLDVLSATAGAQRHLLVYPLVPCYAHTICKAQGNTLSKVAIWFDVNVVPAGTAYVAISRVRRLEDLYFVTFPELHHFQPVSVV